MSRQAYMFEAEVQSNGKLELTIPLPAGSRVDVVVLACDESKGLLDAAISSTDFWDNPVDDAEWNNA